MTKVTEYLIYTQTKQTMRSLTVKEKEEIEGIEKEIDEHRRKPATNAFTEMSWSSGYERLRDYKVALARAGYKSMKERKEDLKEMKKWNDLFQKFPVTEIPRPQEVSA